MSNLLNLQGKANQDAADDAEDTNSFEKLPSMRKSSSLLPNFFEDSSSLSIDQEVKSRKAQLDNLEIMFENLNLRKALESSRREYQLLEKRVTTLTLENIQFKHQQLKNEASDVNPPNLFSLLPNNNNPDNSDNNQHKESNPKDIIPIGEIPKLQKSDYVASEPNERKRKADQIASESIEQVKAF